MKISCVYSDFVPKAKEFYNILSSTYSFVTEKEADVIVCLGGDGFMLHCLHNYMHLNKPLYGINCGSRGFLLNEKKDNIDLISDIKNSSTFNLYPLLTTFTNVKGETNSAFAFNEVSFLRGLARSSHLDIYVNGNKRMEKLIGDGLLIATPAGSTAYNRSCGGNILSTSSNMLALTPINPFNPLNWKGTTVDSNSIIDIHNLDIERPINMSADFHEFENIVSSQIKLIKEKHVSLLFDKNNDLESKIIKHQFNQ